jgi:hypothetical protein
MRQRATGWLVLVAATSCGTYTASLPDGGRGQVNCAMAAPTVPVQVLDLFGAPAPESTVTAVWTSYDDTTQTFTTDGRGVVVLAPQFGPGVVRVKAMLNDLASPVGQLTFSGGDCVTAVTPRDLILQLK